MVQRTGPGARATTRGGVPTRPGPDVLVPPDLEFPTALIDVEDLASWIVDCAQHHTAGLAEAGVRPWMGPTSLPLWIDDESWRCFAILDTTRARAHGLSTRPLGDTLAAALASEERRAQPRQAGLTDTEERHVRSLLT